MIYSNVLDLIGNTPLVKYNDNIMLKLEQFNPAGSIKDRVAYSMIQSAIDRGDIDENTAIIEPTSGNTGIGLAMICAVMNLKLTICMPENMSEERKKIISAYGAELVLTPANMGMKGSVDKALELSKQYKKSFIPMQFSNKDNLEAHKQTAKEIIDDTNNNVDVVVAGIGTGGTAFGLKKYLKNSMVIGVEPEESPLFTKGKAGAHGIQGIGANFIPELCKGKCLDDIVTIDTKTAIEEAKEIAKKKGLFIGISGGANLAAAKKIAEKYPQKSIVAIIPDSGERYLSVW